LKSPLATISAQAQLLRRAAGQEEELPSDRVSKGATRIEATVERMTRMIDELLDVARLELGSPLQLQPQSMDLVEVVRRIVAEHQQRTDYHLIRLAAEPVLFGEWDLARLERVLDNLLGNAVKYSPDGGVITVVVVREEEDTGAWAILSVRDQGVGIPVEDLGHIFERFHRARNVGRISGTGIGLAAIRGIVEQHGGTITVDSREGAGSTFSVRLPVL
jgi:signal transduction histidine kinase